MHGPNMNLKEKQCKRKLVPLYIKKIVYSGYNNKQKQKIS